MHVDRSRTKSALGLAAATLAKLAVAFSEPKPEGSDMFEKMISAINLAIEAPKRGEWFSVLYKAMSEVEGLKEEAMRFCSACGACCNPKCAAFDEKKEKEQCRIYDAENEQAVKTKVKILFMEFTIKKKHKRFSDIPFAREGADEVEKLRILKGRARPLTCTEVTPAHTLVNEWWVRTECEKLGGTSMRLHEARFSNGRPCIRAITDEAAKRGITRREDGRFVMTKRV